MLEKSWDHWESPHPQDPGPQSLPKTEVDRITEKAPDVTAQLASASLKQQQSTAEGIGEWEDPLWAHSEALQLRAEEKRWKKPVQQPNPHPKHQLTHEELETSSALKVTIVTMKPKLSSNLD